MDQDSVATKSVRIKHFQATFILMKALSEMIQRCKTYHDFLGAIIRSEAG